MGSLGLAGKRRLYLGPGWREADFTGRYAKPIFGFVMGMNRWLCRVIAYPALMTDPAPALGSS